MRIRGPYLRGSVLPTVIAVSLVILAGLMGLLSLWEWETQLFARSEYLRRARADADAAYLLYSRHPDCAGLTAPEGYALYDSLPRSLVQVRIRPWGLYEAVIVETGDSSLRLCRLFGAEPDSLRTLFYADNRSSLTLAGKTILQGRLAVPRNGIMYGRIGSDFYSGPEIRAASIRPSEAGLPAPAKEAAERIKALFAEAAEGTTGLPPDSLRRSFVRDSTAVFRLGDALLADCRLSGNILLSGDEVHIGAACRLENIVLCARKVIIEEGARFSAQIFARDTVLIGAGSVLEYPSGIYTQGYAELGDDVRIDGYVIVRDTTVRKKVTANYRQARTARLRGLLWVDGMAQVQGVVSGEIHLRQAVYFSPQGYYKDFLYDLTLLGNPLTAHPLWTAGENTRRKEALCID